MAKVPRLACYGSCVSLLSRRARSSALDAVKAPRRANAKPRYMTKGPARKRLPFRVRSRNWVVVNTTHPLVDLMFCIFSRLYRPLAFICPPEVAVRLAAGKLSRSVKHDLVTARSRGTRHAGGYSQIGGSQAAHGGHRGRSGSPILSPPFKTVSHRTLRRLAAAYHNVAMYAQLWIQVAARGRAPFLSEAARVTRSRGCCPNLQSHARKTSLITLNGASIYPLQRRSALASPDRVALRRGLKLERFRAKACLEFDRGRYRSPSKKTRQNKRLELP
jgi:hypothetical protein